MYLDPPRDRPQPDQLCLDAAGAFALPVFAEGSKLYVVEWLFDADREDSGTAVCGLLEWARARRNLRFESAEAQSRGYRLYDLELGYETDRLVRFITEIADG